MELVSDFRAMNGAWQTKWIVSLLFFFPGCLDEQNGSTKQNNDPNLWNLNAWINKMELLLGGRFSNLKKVQPSG